MFAELVLLGVQPSEIERMTDDDKWDVLNIAGAQGQIREEQVRRAQNR